MMNRRQSLKALSLGIISPAVIPSIAASLPGHEDKWLIYADPFFNNFMAWETTDFKNFTRIPVSAPRGSKHYSILPVTEDELNHLLQ